MGVGAVAAATAMAMRLNGISHWVMWEMASLFEHIGTVQDGLATLTKPQSWWMRRPRCRADCVSHGEVRFDHVMRFALPNGKVVVDGHGPDHQARREDRPGRPQRRRQEHAGQPAAAPVRPGARRRWPHPHRRPGHRRRHAGLAAPPHRHGHAGHLAAAPLGGRQHPVRPPRRRCRSDMQRAAVRAHADEFIASLSDPKGRTGFEAHRGRARRQAQRRPAPAHRHRPRDAGRTRPSCCWTRPPARWTARSRRPSSSRSTR